MDSDEKLLAWGSWRCINQKGHILGDWVGEHIEIFLVCSELEGGVKNREVQVFDQVLTIPG